MSKRDPSVPGPDARAAAAELVGTPLGARPEMRAAAPGDGAPADQAAAGHAAVHASAGHAPADLAAQENADPAAPHPRLGPDLQAVIGEQLRAVYHEIVSEPVPDRFVRLLQELAARKADPQAADSKAADQR